MNLSTEQLQGLAGGGALDMQSLIGSLGQKDPGMGAILSTILQQRAAQGESDDQTSGREALEHEQQLHAATRAQHEKLRRIADRMHDELLVLRQRNRQLACAVGACPACWGEAPDCEMCGGEGAPGSALPRRDMFNRYVWPAAQQRVAAGSAQASIVPNHRAGAGVSGGLHE